MVLYDQARRYDDLNQRYSDRLPTLAVVVQSPSDKWGKVLRRIVQFLSWGVAVIWLVDPEGRSVTVYRASQLPQVFEGSDELAGDPELPGFRCRVADFFYRPGEEATPPQAGRG